MSYLLDAHWLMSFLNGRDEAVELISKLSPDGIGTSVVVCGEIYEGLEGFAGVRTRLTQFAEFLETIKLYGLDLSVARAYASLRSELRSQGRLIPDNDIWIAATALVLGLTVVSRDRHFQRIPQLRLYLGT